MSQYQNSSIGTVKLVTAATNLLNQHILESKREDAKRIFQALHDGKRVRLVKLKMEDASELDIDLGLDYSEFKGKLNFSLFRNLLTLLIARLADTLREEGDLRMFTDEMTGHHLFLVPAMSSIDDVVNMMVLGLQQPIPGAMTLQLQFLNPDQFAQEAAAEAQ